MYIYISTVLFLVTNQHCTAIGPHINLYSSTDFFKASIEKVIVLVHKPCNGVGDISSIVDQAELVPLNSLATLVVQLLMTAGEMDMSYT